MKRRRILHVRTWEREVLDVYVYRDPRWFPNKLLLTLSDNTRKYTKKLFSSFEEIQSMMGYMISVDDPKKSLIWQKLSITETAKAVD